nr:MAG TPA: hypothetical protein [Caudoviricetes sp.]
MRLLAHRLGHQCNGEPYDTPAIAQKAYRLACAAVMACAEEISATECRRGLVRLLDALDYGYALEITDARHDRQLLWLSDDQAPLITAYTGWMRELQ